MLMLCKHASVYLIPSRFSSPFKSFWKNSYHLSITSLFPVTIFPSELLRHIGRRFETSSKNIQFFMCLSCVVFLETCLHLYNIVTNELTLFSPADFFGFIPCGFIYQLFPSCQSVHPLHSKVVSSRYHYPTLIFVPVSILRPILVTYCFFCGVYYSLLYVFSVYFHRVLIIVDILMPVSLDNLVFVLYVSILALISFFIVGIVV